MDNTAEIALTIGAAFAAALFLAYHHGKATTTVTQQNIQLPPNQPPPPIDFASISGDAANAANAYDPNADIPNGFTIDLLGGPNLTLDQRPLNIIVDTTSPVYNFPQGETIPINNDTINIIQNLTTLANPRPWTPVNVSNGTPQCGCNQDDFSTLDAIAAAQSAAYMKTLAAIMAIPPVEPASNIYVTIQKPADTGPLSGLNKAAEQHTYTSATGQYWVDQFAGYKT